MRMRSTLATMITNRRTTTSLQRTLSPSPNNNKRNHRAAAATAVLFPMSKRLLSLSKMPPIPPRVP